MPVEPCKLYDIQIFINGDDEGTELVTLPRQNENTEDLGPVRGLNVTVNDNSATVVWNKPNEEACIEYYGVTLFDNEEEIKNEQVKTTQIVFYDLEHCVSYRIAVVPYENEEGWGESNERTFRTDTTQPSQVQSFVWESNSTTTPLPATSLNVRWEKPTTGSRCVNYNKVKLWRKSNTSDIVFNDNVTDTRASFAELDACEIYVIEVTPSITETMEGKVYRHEMEMAARETIAPTPLRSTGSTATSLSFVTKSEDSKIVCQLYLVKFICAPVEEESGTGVCRLGERGCYVNEANKFEKEEIINNEMEEYETTIDGLEPYTLYNCAAQLKNEKGWSNLVYGINFRTSEAVPGRPKKVEVNDARSTSFRAIWEPPDKENGKITTYNGFVKIIELLYPVPKSGCPRIDYDDIQFTQPGTVFDYRVENLFPYSSYSVQVAAATSKGIGDYSDTSYVETLTAASEPVRYYGYTINLPKSVEVYDASVTFNWQLPCRTNGKLQGYELDLYGTRQGYEDHHFKTFINDVDDEELSFEVTEIRAAYQYNCTIVPITNYPGRNRENFMIIQTPSSVPHANNITDWGTVNIRESSKTHKHNPTKNAEVLIAENVLKSDAGDIVYLAILLSERGCQDDPTPLSAVSFEWPDLKTWSEATNEKCISQYQTTPTRWNITNRSIDTGSTVFIRYIVGTDGCDGLREDIHCNGPLKPGTSYAAVLRIFTRSGYSDTQPIYFRTGNS